MTNQVTEIRLAFADIVLANWLTSEQQKADKSKVMQGQVDINLRAF